MNQLSNRSQFAPEFFLGLLNSNLISWYVYRFIVGRAIRTIHFDTPVTSCIPVPGQIDASAHDQLVRLVREMLESPSAKIDRQIDLQVCRLFDLEKGEARAVRV